MGPKSTGGFRRTEKGATDHPSVNVTKFILDTDASDMAIGAELLQVQDGKKRVVAYGRFTLSPAQRTTHKELLAVVRFAQHFRQFLLGR